MEMTKAQEELEVLMGHYGIITNQKKNENLTYIRASLKARFYIDEGHGG